MLHITGAGASPLLAQVHQSCFPSPMPPSASTQPRQGCRCICRVRCEPARPGRSPASGLRHCSSPAAALRQFALLVGTPSLKKGARRGAASSTRPRRRPAMRSHAATMRAGRRHGNPRQALFNCKVRGALPHQASPAWRLGPDLKVSRRGAKLAGLPVRADGLRGDCVWRCGARADADYGSGRSARRPGAAHWHTARALRGAPGLAPARPAASESQDSECRQQRRRGSVGGVAW